MKRLEIVQRVRALTRDFSNSIFREQDIIDFINEGINRCKQLIPELRGLNPLLTSNEIPSLLPEEYHHLLAVYSASRCFSQDERHYQATNLMNEFEIKLSELKMAIESGEIQIIDEEGSVIDKSFPVDYVNLKPYWGEPPSLEDDDLGVEGVIG